MVQASRTGDALAERISGPWNSAPRERAVAVAGDAAGGTLREEAVLEHLDLLYRAARALCRSREDAEDLVQEVGVRVPPRPRGRRGDPRAYLMTVLRNTFTSSLRTASRRPAVVAALNEEIA